MTELDTPQSRRVLVAFAQAKWDALDRGAQRVIAGQPGVAVLIIDGEPHMDPEVSARVLSDYTVAHGAVLIQNPYDTSRYFGEDGAAIEIALEKTLCVAAVCHLLGARSFEVHSVQNATDGTEWNADAGGGAEGMVAKLSSRGGKSKQLGQRIRLKDTSTGGEPDIDAARAYLTAHNLGSDGMLTKLVDMVAFAGNSIRQRTLTVDVSREAKSTLELALEVKAADYGAGNAGGGRKKGAIDQFTVSYEINF